jgi:trans-aconitate methyltransferase
VTEISPTATDPDWRGLLDGWDRQQTGYIPQRERMFTLMVDTVHAVLGDDPLVLDLACGPGAVSERLLARFPRARSVAIDMDPVLLAIGRGALDTRGGRLRWVDQDLRDHDWTKAVGDQPFDAVLTTTALHWLFPEDLAATYRRIATILRPGGLMVICLLRHASSALSSRRACLRAWSGGTGHSRSGGGVRRVVLLRGDSGRVGHRRTL